MLVCHCRVVNDRAVKRAIERGADSVEEIGAACGAGTCCGGCHPELERLLSERAGRLVGAGSGPAASAGSSRGWRTG